MQWSTKLRLRLRSLLHRDHVEAELDEELRFHLERLTDEHIAAGMTPADARYTALRAMGGLDQTKEECRDARGTRIVDDLAQDLRYALRTLRRAPIFAATAVLSLALGIGATTAVFGVLDAVVLRPLSVARPDRLVILQPEERGQRFVLFNPLFEELRRRQSVVAGMFAVSNEPFLKATLPGATIPGYLRGSFVSGNYFSVLGLEAAAGRLLMEADDEPSAPCVVVISHGFWTRQFDRDPSIVGRHIRVRETACDIVGVAPAAFRSNQVDYAPDLWAAVRRHKDAKILASHRMAFFAGVMGRLREGVSVAQAEAQLTALYQEALRAGPPLPDDPEGRAPSGPGDFRIRLRPGAQGFEGVRRHFGQPLWLVLAVVAVFLLIATANVANLLLARGAARTGELATRAALGAGHGRLLRQLATEGIVLSCFGGLAGVALAWLTTPVLASGVVLPHGGPRLAPEAAADGGVLLFAAGISTLTALLTGLLPAWRLSRESLHSLAARGGRTSGRSDHRLARRLVTAQIALSLLLVATTGLLLRTMARIAAIDPGFRPDGVLLLDVYHEEPGPGFGNVDGRAEKARLARLYRSLDEQLNGVAGVRSASLSWLGLFGGSDMALGLIDPDRAGDMREGRVDYVSSRYFETVEMQILRGRGITEGDVEGAPRVAVVNEALVRARFDNVEALGRRLALEFTGEQTRPFTIVGVVRDSRYNDRREDQTKPMMWVPLAQAPQRIKSVALRTEASGEQTGLVRQVRALLTAADPRLMVRRVTTLSAQMDETTARERLLLRLNSGIGALALVLTAVGVYATLAYAVTRRTRELGIRMALGARRGTVIRMILGEVLGLVAAGALIGVPLSVVAGYVGAAFLYGVTPHDGVALVSACSVLAVVVAFAAYLPARLASRIDPMAALRCE